MAEQNRTSGNLKYDSHQQSDFPFNKVSCPSPPFLQQRLIDTRTRPRPWMCLSSWKKWKVSQCHSPLKQEEVDIVVALGEEVSQHAGRVTAADLIGRQPEVDALDKVPHLSDRVLVETSGRERKRNKKKQQLPFCFKGFQLKKGQSELTLTFLWLPAGWRTSRSGCQTPGWPGRWPWP